jgi:hypothetical protein
MTTPLAASYYGVRKFSDTWPPLRILHVAAFVMKSLAGFMVLVAVVVSCVVCSIKGGSPYSDHRPHPFVGLGLSLGFMTLVVAVVVFFVGAWASAWVQTKRQFPMA